MRNMRTWNFTQTSHLNAVAPHGCAVLRDNQEENRAAARLQFIHEGIEVPQEPLGTRLEVKRFPGTRCSIAVMKRNEIKERNGAGRL